MKEQIKELRIKIDGLSQLVEGLYGSQLYLMDIENIPKGMSIRDYIRSYTEMYKCYDSLILAKAWLGKVLGELAEATPYANDGNRKTVEDIESAADKHTLLGDTMSDFNLQFCNPDGTTPSISWTNKKHIEKVDWLRQEIKLIVISLENIEGYIDPSVNTKPSCKLERYTNQSLYYLIEARFWLGFGLQRIKENK